MVQMRRFTYPAIFQASGENGFSVSFPDFEHCCAQGKTFEAAQTCAGGALKARIHELEERKEQLPFPSSIFALSNTIGHNEFVSPITVYPELNAADQWETEMIEKTLSIPAWLAEAAEEEGMDLSRVLEIALLDYLNIASRR